MSLNVFLVVVFTILFIALIFMISVLFIRKGKRKGEYDKYMIGVIQLILIIIFWVSANYFYIDLLNIFDDGKIIFVIVLLLAFIVGLLNYKKIK